MERNQLHFLCQLSHILLKHSILIKASMCLFLKVFFFVIPIMYIKILYSTAQVHIGQEIVLAIFIMYPVLEAVWAMIYISA